MDVNKQWIDKNGFIKPRLSWIDSGNGITYTALFLMLKDRLNDKINFYDHYNFEMAISRCRVEAGLYARTPEHTYGQEQWDDYLGLCAWSILSKDKGLAREILIHGFEHFGFYNTDDTLETRDFLWRSTHVFFGLLFIASFPNRFVKAIMKPFLWFFALFLNAKDSNGVFLDWMWFQSLAKAGYVHPKLKILGGKLEAALKEQLDESHPCVEMAGKL